MGTEMKNAFFGRKHTLAESISFHAGEDIFLEQSLKAAAILCVLQGCQRQL
jgi:hypothetical protein